MQPEYPPGSGRALYLAHCVDGVSYNYCNAVCAGKTVSSINKGSCERCEARCGMVFKPVCSQDQSLVYANKCQASCAGDDNTTECQGQFSVIPGTTSAPSTTSLLISSLQILFSGKSKLPLNFREKLPEHLQTFNPSPVVEDNDI